MRLVDCMVTAPWPARWSGRRRWLSSKLPPRAVLSGFPARWR